MFQDYFPTSGFLSKQSSTGCGNSPLSPKNALPTTSESSAPRTGVRNAVQGLLSVVASENHSRSSQSGNLYPSRDRLMEKHREALQRRVPTQAQLQQVVMESPESFHRIQNELRCRHAQTDSLAKELASKWIQVCWLEIQHQKRKDEAEAQESERQLRIARELTEARIKSQQALKLTSSASSDKGSDTEEDFSSSSDEDTNNVVTNSPTTVTTCVDMNDGTFKGDILCSVDALDEDDIQEVS